MREGTETKAHSHGTNNTSHKQAAQGPLAPSQGLWIVFWAIGTETPPGGDMTIHDDQPVVMTKAATVPRIGLKKHGNKVTLELQTHCH